jgi:TatD DNase family protein
LHLKINMFIDIHTHKVQNHADELAIININSHFENSFQEGFYSMGLHPWYLSDSANYDYKQLCNGVLSKNIIAVGEIGLDKICNVDFNLQINYFQKQIELANEVNKPMIIHCVKAHEEVLSILKESKVNVPVIFHGFNRKVELAERIIKDRYYLSFGKSLFSASVQSYFATLPFERVFFETDDSDFTIEQVYQKASEISDTDIEEVKSMIATNCLTVFGNKFVGL